MWPTFYHCLTARWRSFGQNGFISIAATNVLSSNNHDDHIIFNFTCKVSWWILTDGCFAILIFSTWCSQVWYIMFFVDAASLYGWFHQVFLFHTKSSMLVATRCTGVNVLVVMSWFTLGSKALVLLSLEWQWDSKVIRPYCLAFKVKYLHSFGLQFW